MAKVDDDSNQRFQLVYNRAEHPTLKNFHQTRCKTCYNEKKQEKYYSKNAIRRLSKLLDTPCNSNLEYLPKEIHTKKGSHDRKEYCSLEKMQTTSCKACAHDKRNHNYYTLLSKEFQKLKNDIEELKLSVLSIKNECSNCNHIKRKNEFKNHKKNSKYKRIRILK
ncbi:hypothetical protein O3M35_001478 [Rhynocoris fuscipes]|uniref:Uncharacterized protein n=1 Tax=Rhynocoris fuscipes TaxID=488301 RepID=A0AAW1CMN0_9HEMI